MADGTVFRSFEFPEVLRRAIASACDDRMSGFPGIVKSYDASKMLAVITPAVRRPLPTAGDDDKVAFEAMPDITDVPMCFARGGGCYISFPVNPGDHVWVAISSLDPGGWRDTGVVSDAKDTRQHHIAHGFAIPCVGPDAATLAGAVQNALVLEGPSILIGAGATQFIAMANKVQGLFDDIIFSLGTAESNPGGGTLTFPDPLPVDTDVAATKGKVE